MTSRNKIVTFIKKLDEEKKELNNTAVSANKEFTNFLKNNNIKCCHSCFSQTCLAKYNAAKATGVGYQANKSCKRNVKGWKGWNFGHLEKLKLWEVRKLGTATVSIQPEPVSSKPGDLYDILTPDVRSHENFMIPSQMARVTARPRFTARTVPKSDEILTDTGTDDKESAAPVRCPCWTCSSI